MASSTAPALALVPSPSDVRIARLETELHDLRRRVAGLPPSPYAAHYPNLPPGVALDVLTLDALTERRKAFVQEYLVDLNASKAAIRAGYRNPQAGAGLLEDPLVLFALDRAISARLARVQLRQDAVVDELSLLATSTHEHYYVNGKGEVAPKPGAPYGCMRAIQTIKRRIHRKRDADGNIVEESFDVEYKLYDKVASLKLLGQHMGMKFNDRVEVTGEGGGPILTRVVRQVVDAVADAPRELSVGNVSQDETDEQVS